MGNSVQTIYKSYKLDFGTTYNFKISLFENKIQLYVDNTLIWDVALLDTFIGKFGFAVFDNDSSGSSVEFDNVKIY